MCVHLKVPGWLSDLKALLTRELPMLLSRLNEIRGSREKLKFLRILITFLTARFSGW